MERVSRLSITSGKEGRRRSLTKSSKTKDVEQTETTSPVEPEKPTDSHLVCKLEDWARNMFCQQLYSKAAILLQHLNKDKDDKDAELPAFNNEFERKRAYGMAFAAKRHTAVLNEVIEDSTYANSFWELLEIHKATILIMLMDFYEHKFNAIHLKKQCDFYEEHYLDHIDEISTSLYKFEIKLSAAFARQRIEYCAPSLDEMLPEEEKEERKHASKHPVYVRINTAMIEPEVVLQTLQNNGFHFHNNIPKEFSEGGRVCCFDEHYDGLLTFPSQLKDDIYCMDITLNHQIIPQSKPRYIVGELVKYCLNDLVISHVPSTKSLSELLNDTKLEPAVSTQIDHILLTHPESGTLSSHITSFLDENNKLLICGGNTHNGELMEHMLKNVEARNYAFLGESFTDISPTNEFLKFCKVVICNPPCSKSGVVNRVDFILNEGLTAGLPLSKVAMAAKLPELTQLQSATLSHATRIPGVQQIVYCTFSNNTIENEGVIEKVLRKENNQFELSSILSEIVSNHYHPSINGKKGHHLSLSPSDKMDGFFVTLLKRKREHINQKLHNVLKKRSHATILEKKKSKAKKKKSKTAFASSTKSEVKSSKKELLPKKSSTKKLSSTSSKKLVSKKQSKASAKRSKKSVTPTSGEDSKPTETVVAYSSADTRNETSANSAGDRFKF